MKAYRGIIQIECDMKVCPEDHVRKNVVATCEACIHGHNSIVDLTGMPLIRWQAEAKPEQQVNVPEPFAESSESPVEEPVAIKKVRSKKEE